MRKIKAAFFIPFFLLSYTIVFAQDNGDKTMIGETMRSNGRIYVVVAVMLTILTGLILYLVRLDKKMGKIENEIK